MSCSKVDVAAVPEEAKERVVVMEHGINGGGADAAATNGKRGEAQCGRKDDGGEEEDDEDGEKVPEAIELGPILSIKDQLEKDKVCIVACNRFSRHHLNYSCCRYCLQSHWLLCCCCRSISSFSSQLQDDESLRRWKEQLLGSVDLNSVGGKLILGQIASLLNCVCNWIVLAMSRNGTGRQQ